MGFGRRILFECDEMLFEEWISRTFTDGEEGWVGWMDGVMAYLR